MRSYQTDSIRIGMGLKLLRGLGLLQAAVHKFVFKEPVWISADGKVQSVSQLGDNHLRNILHMMIRDRQDTEQAEMYAVLELERERRGLRRKKQRKTGFFGDLQ